MLFNSNKTMKQIKIVFYFLCCFSILSSSLHAQSRKKNIQIGILIDTISPELAPYLIQLKNEIKAVVGEDATIIFNQKDILTNNFNIQTANKNYHSLVENKDIDIIIASGLVNNFALLQHKTFTKPVIVFGEINQDFITDDIKNKTKTGIPNLTYLFT